MKKLLIALVALVTFAAVPASAQTYLTTTTITAAVNATQTTVPLNATTSVAAGSALYIDHELMQVTAINTTTKIATVIRAQRPAAHANAAVVYVATSAQKTTNFITHQAAIAKAGVCSSSTSSTPATALSGQILPFVDTDTGDIYGCRRNGTGGTWVWNITNVTGYNGAGSIPTAWP